MATVSSIASGRVRQRASGVLLNGVVWRPVVIVASIVAAYFFSLSDLLRAMKYDTPLAYLGLVPPVAFVIGCYRYHRAGASPTPVGPLDVVAGSALLVLATLIGIGLPVALDAYAWSKRLDLVSLPIFAAGLVVVLYGTSALRWAWPALAYGFLIWPVPYGLLLDRLLNPLTDVTAWATAQMTNILPLGATTDATDATVFTIATPDGPQAVSIGSACSGFNSFVAWIVIGIALCAIVRGKRGNEGGFTIAGQITLWILAGTFLTLLGNVARILVLFAVAHHSGLTGTFEWVHALLGVSLFALIVLVMLLILPLFRLVLRVFEGTAPPIAPVNPSPFPAQAAFLALGGLVLAGGALISVGIFQMVLVFILLFLMCLLFTHDFSGTAAGAPSQTGLAPPTPMHPTRVLGVVMIVVSFAIMMYLASRYLASCNDAIQALGWQIGSWQQETLSGVVRFFVAAALFSGALAVAATIVRAPRYLPGADRRLSMRPLTGPLAATVVAGIILITTGTLSLANVTVASFGSSATTTSVPAGDFDLLTPDLPDLQRTFVESYDWPKQFLGNSSTYNRYAYDAQGVQPFWLDVLTTEDADALAYHKVQNCYAFHGYINEGEREVGTGNGVTVRIVNYLKPDVNETWSTLYWEQRVERGDKLFYQRIVMLYALPLTAGEGVVGSHFTANNALMQARATQVLNGLIAPTNR